MVPEKVQKPQWLPAIISSGILYFQHTYVMEGHASMQSLNQWYYKLIKQTEYTQNTKARKILIPTLKVLLKELKVLEQRMQKLLYSLETSE